MRPGRFASCLLIFTFFATSSYAQDDEYDKYFEMSMDELINLEISVASKTNEAYSNSPSSVYVFTSVEIENMGVTSVEELLNYVPGYFTGLDIEQGKAYRIGARGRTTALSESILFLVNGHRLNDLYTGGVSIINRLIPVENIKQIEVIRGPGSSLYGSNAFLGVVNIVTKENVNDVKLSYGSYHGISGAGNFSKTVSDVTFNAFVKGFSNDGYEFNDFEDLLGRKIKMTDPEQGFDALMDVSYKGLTMEGRHHEREFKGFYGLGGVADFNNNEQSSQTMLNLGQKISASEKLEFNIKAGFRSEIWKTKAVILPAGAADFTEDFFAGPLMKSKAYTFSTDMACQLADKNELLAGVSYENAGINKAVSLTTHDFTGDFSFFGGIREYYLSFNNTDDQRNVWGLFVQDRHSINDKLRFTIGARLDSYSDFGTSINPRGAVIYSTPFKSIVKVMYGQAFRAPNYLELYDQNNPVDYGNNDLKAEEIKTFEVAYMHTLAAFSATVTYFNNTIKNLIFLDPDRVITAENNPIPGVPSFSNQQNDLNTSGLEFEAIIKPIDNFSATLTFTQLFGDYTAMPEKMASARLNFKMGKFNLNLNGIYHGEIMEVAGQSGYVVINSKLRFMLNDISLFAKVNNITDKVYRTPSTLTAEGVVNRGRMMTLGISLDL